MVYIALGSKHKCLSLHIYVHYCCSQSILVPMQPPPPPKLELMGHSLRYQCIRLCVRLWKWICHSLFGKHKLMQIKPI